jgi:hypothetical protein
VANPVVASTFRWKACEAETTGKTMTGLKKLFYRGGVGCTTSATTNHLPLASRVQTLT